MWILACLTAAIGQEADTGWWDATPASHDESRESVGGARALTMVSLGEARLDAFLTTDAAMLVAERAAQRGTQGEPVELPEVYRLDLAVDGALGPDAPGDPELIPTLLRIPLAPDREVLKEVHTFEVSDFGVRMWAGADPGAQWPDTWLISWGGVWWGDVTTADGTWWIRPTPDHGTAIVRMVESEDAPPPGMMMSLSEEGGEDDDSTCDEGYQLSPEETPTTDSSLYTPADGEPIDVGVAFTGRVASALWSQWSGYGNYGSVFGQPDDTPFGFMPGNPPVAVVLYAQSRILQTNNILLRSGVTERGVRLAGVVRVREALPDPVAGGTMPLCAHTKVEVPNGAGSVVGWRCTKTLTCSCCPDATTWNQETDGVYEKGNDQFVTRWSFVVLPGFLVDEWQRWEIRCGTDWRPPAPGFGVPLTGDQDSFPDPPPDPMGLVRQATTGTDGPLPLYTQVDGTLNLDQWRDLVGADLVGVLQSELQKSRAGVAHNDLGVNKQPLLKRSKAGFVASIANIATNEWTFSHELGHTLGIVHGDKVSAIWQDGINHRNAGAKATGPAGDERATLMHSGNGVPTPRLPVLSNVTVDWAPGPVRVPTNQGHRVDGALVPFSTGLPLWDTNANAAGYLEAIWHFGVSPLKRRASHTLPVPNSDLRLVAPADHTILTGNSFVWMGGSYAAANPTATDAWRVDFGTTFGASDLGSEDVPASILDPSSGTVTWTTSTSLPGGPLYMRLWWRMGPGNAWLFRDLAFNVADTLISCADEDPSFAGGFGACSVTPPGGGAAVPPCWTDVLDAGLPTERTQLHCDVAAAGLPGSPGPNAFLSARGRHQQWGDYDFWLRGRTHDGQAFCCLFDSHVRPVSFIGLHGAMFPEEYDLGGYPGAGPPLAPLRPAWPFPSPRLAVQVRALASSDHIYGSSYVGLDYWEFLLGGLGADTIETGPGYDRVNSGQQDDVVTGVGHTKLIVDITGADQIQLGVGYHMLCDADGQNDVTSGGDPVSLYVSPGFTPGALSIAAGSACGWTSAPGTPPAWAPAACAQQLLAPIPDCNEPMVCPNGGCAP